MKKDEAMKLAVRCTQELVDSIQGAGTDRLRLYLDAVARFRHYSFGNIMMILAQCPQAEHVAGFRTWKQLGRWVRPGEKGIAIFAPMIQKIMVDGSKAETPERRLRGFRVVHVFDYSQTEGRDVLELSPVTGDPGESLRCLERVYRSVGIAVEYGPLPGSARGASMGGRVRLREDLSPEMEFRVLAHELAHELLHQGGQDDEPVSRTVAETEAEAVAYVVCQASQVDSRELSSEYIRLHDGDAKLLERSFERVRSTACQILHLMEEVELSVEEPVHVA